MCHLLLFLVYKFGPFDRISFSVSVGDLFLLLQPSEPRGIFVLQSAAAFFELVSAFCFAARHVFPPARAISPLPLVTVVLQSHRVAPQVRYACPQSSALGAGLFAVILIRLFPANSALRRFALPLNTSSSSSSSRMSTMGRLESFHAGAPVTLARYRHICPDI